MNNKSKIILVLFTSALFALCSFTIYSTKEIKFVTPKGWPKPHYDLTKNPVTTEGFELGKLLFFDQLLSRDSSTSCASCHIQFTGYTHIDHALSHGINGLFGTRNSPVIFNMAWSTSFMWDGGVNHLEVQPLAPITNPVEMDSNLETLIKKLNSKIYYRKRFYKAFGDSSITSQNMLKAITQFVVMLESYNSKYDKVQRKEKGNAFTEMEMKGYALFKANCASCHKEPLFTDNSFQNNGLLVDPELNDGGRIRITKNLDDSLKFKVPTLRNIAVTFPYMHDGRFKTLKQVLDHYTSGAEKHNKLTPQSVNSIALSETDKNAITVFLQTLTDKEFLLDMRFRRPQL
jgi:cytochrome c peroxidase